MNEWLRLIRWKNLLIVFLTQLLVWYCLIYEPTNFRGFITILDFLPVAVSTVLIAAAGYVINDYFDIKIDIINRPDKVILEKKIPLRVAIMAHVGLNILALSIASIAASRGGHYEWLLVQLGCTVILWFYSTDFKRQFVIGNVVVALLTALTILILIVYMPAMPMMHLKRYPEPPPPLISATTICYGYAFFAFALTWMREIVKDMEDYKGDAAEGCMTMPIKKGLEFSQRFIQAIGVITIAVLCLIVYYFFSERYIVLGIYTTTFIVAPLIAWCIFLQRRNTTEHYHAASKWLKVIMVAGICSLIVYHFTNSIH